MKYIQKNRDQHFQNSIAVLPFVSFSNTEENDYFADGITEEIINALTKVNSLKVIARTSSFAFKGKNIDVRTIGKQLNVSAILEGSIRRSEQTIRITAQLIETKKGMHLWSENFDRPMGDIFQLQDEISLLIADQIRENFGHFDIQEHLVNKQTDSIRAYELFLQARFFQLQWTPESLKNAVDLYNQSTLYDRNFARSYYGLVQSYGLLSIWGYLPKEESRQLASDSFLKARTIDTSLPEYQQSLIGKSFWGEWDFQLTYKLLQQVLDKFPHYTDALEAMAELMIANGYFDMAERYMRIALEIDPLSANHHYTLANIFYYQKDFDRAIELLQKAIELNSELQLTKELLLICQIWKNDKENFLIGLKDSLAPHWVELLYKAINQKSFQLDSSQIEQLIQSAKRKDLLIPYELYILSNLNPKDKAIEILKEYIFQKRGQIINFQYDPLLLNLQKFEEVKQLFPQHLRLVKNDHQQIVGSASEKISAAEIKMWNSKLDALMTTNQAYLNPKLSIRELASEMEIHPNKLSFFINQKFDRNFNEFVNEYRLKHFKQIALSSKFDHLSILGKALESGFNSKTVFNSYFKKQTGLSPKEWMKQQSN